MPHRECLARRRAPTGFRRELLSPPKPSDGEWPRSRETLEERGISLDQAFGRGRGLFRIDCRANRRQDNRAAFMHRDVDLISDFDAGQVHECSVKDNSLRVTDFGNGFGHSVILCFT